jgi:hypothetical protein
MRDFMLPAQETAEAASSAACAFDAATTTPASRSSAIWRDQPRILFRADHRGHHGLWPRGFY